MMQKITVSIVICTFRHVDLLKGVVQSLVNQSASPDCYEIIVVDNDPVPNPGFREIVSSASQHISIRYLHEPQSGLSFARNTGGKAAEADYIGYMDDDARANPKYIETLVNIISQIKPDMVGGPYIPFYLSPKPQWFLDRYGSDIKGSAPRFLSSREYLAGLNMVFRRRLLEELGWFDTRLSQIGYKRMGGEDTMMQIIAWNNHPALSVYYDPALMVEHLVPARKMSLRFHTRMYYDMGLAQVYFWMPEAERIKARRRAPFYLISCTMRALLKIIPGIIFRDRQRYPFWQNFYYEYAVHHAQVIGGQFRLAKDYMHIR